jgi:hypothetical protein
VKIAFVVSSENTLASAGVRIRYKRLISRMSERGYELSIIPIGSLLETPLLQKGVYIFCKCYDARSLVLAEMLRRSGSHVGIDIFDDYFTQEGNPRFVHLREWLRAVAPRLNFWLCSTSRMRHTISALLPGVASHVLNDAFDTFDGGSISATVERNIERALTTRIADVAWFGMGDNPHFKVGIHDLAAFAGTIRAFKRGGFEPRLTILTNKRALTVEGLELISGMGVPFLLEEWSEALEAELLRNSLVSLLPVNIQTFSIAKSLNRAVTALTSGSQVLSQGFPLYSELSPFVYRDVQTLIDDVEAQRPLLRRETTSDLSRKLHELAMPDNEVDNLIAFLRSLGESDANAAPLRAAVIHGPRSNENTHRLFQEFGHLSVASPFHAEYLDYDVRVLAGQAGALPTILLTRQAVNLLALHHRRLLTGPEKIGQQTFWRLPIPDLGALLATSYNDATSRAHTVKLSEYDRIMTGIAKLIVLLFGEIEVFLSTLESPFWTDLSHRLPYTKGQELS